MIMLHNRYPGADALDQRDHWDAATRRVVLDRVHNVPPFRRFDAHQQAVLEALCARVIPQGWKPADRRVPIAPRIDQQCTTGPVGEQYDDMPSTATAWERGLEGLDQTAAALYGFPFSELGETQQDQVLEAVRGGSPMGEVWQRMPAGRWWRQVALRQITGAYYAHPYAWDEIGFGGPAYPRGYFALNFGAREPWEVGEALATSGEETR
jgi:hypothetical protein